MNARRTEVGATGAHALGIDSLAVANATESVRHTRELCNECLRQPVLPRRTKCRACVDEYNAAQDRRRAAARRLPFITNWTDAA